MKTRKNKIIQTEWDEIALSVLYEETIDIQPDAIEFGHGEHRIPQSTLEQELLSVNLKIGDEQLNILPALSIKQRTYIISQI